MMHKSTTTSWVKPPSTFTPAPELGRPPGGSSPVIHFFRDQETGDRWIGKLGQVPLRDREVIEAARRLPGFLGVYADEILEKLGLAVYQLLGTEVPESALSYQQVTMEAMHPDMLLAMQLNAEDEGRVFELPHSPRMHYLSRYVDEFQPLNKDFVEHYLANAKRCGNEYVKIQTCDGEMLPLRGLGCMLAAADFLYDLDCLGDSCGNAGYVMKEDAATGERYAQLVKIDAGYAFSYSALRTDQTHNPKDRQIRVAPNQLRLQFADLAPADQKEFAAAAKRILEIPYEEFAHLFSKTEEVQEGLSLEHWLELLNGLIARKRLFLKAFAPETDRTIVEEIEAAQAKVARGLEHSEEVSPQIVGELLAQEKEEAKALAELRVRLAVVDIKESEPKKVGECKTFQLPSTNTLFVGREEALIQVANQLNHSHGSVIGQSISGIGGVGKTQLALHYAQAAANGEAIAGHHLGYDYVIWLNAEVFLEGQFQAMAEVWTGEHLKADEAVEKVYRFLRGKRTLLVFDNVENARSIAAFLPPAKYASPLHFLITSRSAQWGGLPTVKLGGFTLEEAQEYVERHLGTQSTEFTSKLVNLLEGLPLAMSQAVSYIKSGHCTLEDFEVQFYLNQANLLSHELIEEEAHPKTVGTTLSLALAQAKVKDKLAEKLLGIVAYLASESIQITLLCIALEAGKEEVEQTIQVLESYSLINRGRGTVQVHRLVQEAMRHRHKFLSDPHIYWNKIVELLNSVIVYDESTIELVRQCSHAIAHVDHLTKLFRQISLSQEEELNLSLLTEHAGIHQELMGNYESARKFQEQVITIRERHYGLDHVLVAQALANLSLAYGSLGNSRKKKELLEHALAIYERNLSSECIEIADALINLGNAYSDLGEPSKQKEFAERALNIFEKIYGCNHPAIARALVTLSEAYGKLGDASKQKDLLERALSIETNVYSANHPTLAVTLVNLGNAYGSLGNAHKQRDLLEQALRIDEAHYGPDHVLVANTLMNLGIAYGYLGKADKQLELSQRALVIFEKHYGPDHPMVGSLIMNMGNAYGDLGNTNKQKELLERSLSIAETHFGHGSLEVANILVNLGNVYWVLEDSNKEREFLERSLEIKERHLGSEHPQVAIVMTNLARAYGGLGDVGKQKELSERALAIKEQYYGPEYVEVGMTLLPLGSSYGALGNPIKQIEILERALAIVERAYGSNHKDVGIILSNLASAYSSLGDAEKERDLLERALVIFEQHFDPDDFVFANFKENLAGAYGVLGNSDKRRDYLHQALALNEKHYGPDHPRVGEVLVKLGDTYRILCNAKMQKELLKRALTIFENHYGPENIKVTSAVSGLAIAYGSLGDTQKKKKLLKRSLLITERHYGADHPQVAIVFGNLASVYGVLGDNQRKIKMLERVLDIFDRHCAPDYLDTGNALYSLGNAYGALGDLSKKAELLERGLTILEHNYGSYHIEMVYPLLNLGDTYAELGDVEKKKDLLKRAVEISENHHGENHKLVTDLLEQLIQVFLNLKQYSEALKYSQKVHSIFLRAYGERNPSSQKYKRLIQDLEKLVKVMRI